VHVHAQHALELLVLHLEEGAVAHVAGVVDDGMDAAELVHALLDERARSLAARDVVAAGDGLAALLGDLLHDLAGLVRVDVVDDHGGTLLGEVEAVSPPDAAPTAGDHGRLPVQTTHTIPLPCAFPEVTKRSVSKPPGGRKGAWARTQRAARASACSSEVPNTFSRTQVRFR
jgi:hypothetical protein